MMTHLNRSLRSASDNRKHIHELEESIHGTCHNRSIQNSSSKAFPVLPTVSDTFADLARMFQIEQRHTRDVSRLAQQFLRD